MSVTVLYVAALLAHLSLNCSFVIRPLLSFKLLQTIYYQFRFCCIVLCLTLYFVYSVTCIISPYVRYCSCLFCTSVGTIVTGWKTN